jgi:hypothetical protein
MPIDKKEGIPRMEFVALEVKQWFIFRLFFGGKS